MSYHVRTNRTPLEIKDNRRLSFYAVLWDEPTVVTDWAQPYGEVRSYKEVVRPGAFSERIANRGKVVATVDHNPDSAFAEYPGGLLLQEDSKGLFVSAELPMNDVGNAVRNEILQGRLTGASFRFPQQGNSERWTEGEMPFRELLQVKLLDVTLTDAPAYKSTKGEVHLRHQQDPRSRRLKLWKLKSQYIHILTCKESS